MIDIRDTDIETASQEHPEVAAPRPEYRQAHFEPKPGEDLPSTPRQVFDALPHMPGLRTEIIDGRLIVSPVGTPEHARHAVRLMCALLPILNEREWEAFPGNVDVCLDGTRDPVEPDLVIAPLDCPRWGDRELLSSGLILVAEVVSVGSAVHDREIKPVMYARGGVPCYLIIDPLVDPRQVTLMSEPGQGRYHRSVSVTMGEKLEIPEPIGFALDTGIFL
ncbi:Uma2 family endonuclease [Thermocatellispora tengchongensis]|nr:Uma2 family endonuclease [Thermocatellispora tengchongensis]